MTQKPPFLQTAAGDLCLDKALALLAQSGHAQPSGAQGSGPWLQSLIDALCDLSSRDGLTGLANRRYFENALARESDRVARSGEPALLLMLDIDHFKRINDHHGHVAGDLVIKAVADALTATVRPMDLVARIGGEQFAIILPSCPPAFGAAVAERLRGCVEERAIHLVGGQTLEVRPTDPARLAETAAILGRVSTAGAADEPRRGVLAVPVSDDSALAATVEPSSISIKR